MTELIKRTMRAMIRLFFPKKLLLFANLFFVVGLYGQNQSQNYYVYAVNGLKLRDKPSFEGEVITRLGFGDTVNIIEYNDTLPEFKVDGLKGRYVLIKSKELRGYMFSGYLSRLPAPSLTDSWVDLKDYLNKHYTKTGKSETVREPDIGNGISKKTGKLQRYSDNIEYIDFSTECNDAEMIRIEGLSIQEAFLFISTFNLQYRNVNLNKVYKDDGPPDGSGGNINRGSTEQYARYLNTEKDAKGNYKLISICFDAEAGGGCARVLKNETKPNSVIISLSYYCD